MICVPSIHTDYIQNYFMDYMFIVFILNSHKNNLLVQRTFMNFKTALYKHTGWHKFYVTTCIFVT